MTNIWAVLNQTLAVTLVAGFLFFIKWIFRDKLSPRWQYGIWGILLLRMIIPVNIHKSILLPIPIWVEHFKGMVEKEIFSAYTSVYEPAIVKSIFSIIKEKPESITDWLFVIYVIGVVFVLCRYGFSYIQLRNLLRNASPISDEVREKIEYVSAKYNLKSCKAVMISGISSAFICGGMHPVLVIPAEKVLDEKVILHELLHLKYHDELQSIGWCIFKAMHWCNPFMYFIFNEIGNDMESLCDQRVLEYLDGEERREYGVILLMMANDKYARVPGTTSISNGGKNISKRIEAIVRFKKYPKGMALVSICITLLLISPTLLGTDYVFAQDRYHSFNLSEWNFSMSMARVNRCTTVAGVLDTYAQAIMLENDIMLATALPVEQHKDLDAFYLEGSSHVWEKYGLDEMVNIYDSGFGRTYGIWNVEKINDELYKAYIIFYITTDEGNPSSVIIPVEARYEDAWVVQEVGERIVCLENFAWSIYPEKGVPALKQYVAKSDTGEITIRLWTENGIDNSVEHSDNLMNISQATVRLDAEFTSVDVKTAAEYEYNESHSEIPEDFFGVIYKGMEKEDVIPEFEKLYVGAGEGGGYGGDVGESWSGQLVANGNKLILSGGATYYDGIDTFMKKSTVPVSYAVRVFWDGKQVEEMVAKETATVTVDEKNVRSYGQGQRAIYLDDAYTIAFMSEKQDIALDESQLLSMEEIYLLIEEATFAKGDNQIEILEKLEQAGVFKYENNMISEIISCYPQGLELLEPTRYFNANDGSWILAFGGYCYEEDTRILTKEVGAREMYGVTFETEKSVYECGSIINEHRAVIANKDNTIRKTTSNSSGDTNTNGGVWFEMQDYMEKGEYVGYRWFGEITFAPGFEFMKGDMVVFYNHTR